MVKRLTDENFEIVFERIAEGKHYKDIAEEFQTTTWQVFKFITSPKYSAIFEQAKQYCAILISDEVERVISVAAGSGDWLKMRAAQELAHHYRWKASMIYGRQYGQRKVEVPIEGEKKQIKIIVQEDGDGVSS